jgi:tetratricopeptide (TPR) repeat protein
LELLEHAHGTQSASLECLALNRLATLAAQADFDLGQAQQLLHRARSAADKTDDPRDRAETYWNLAQVEYYARELVAARAHADEALAAGRKVGDFDLLGRCLNISAYVLGDSDEVDTAQLRAEEAAHVYRELGNRVLEVDSMAALCALQVIDGRLAKGAATGRRALQISQQIGNVNAEVFSRYHLAMALADSDDLPGAEQLLVEALRLAESGGSSPLVLRLARNVLGSVRRHRGQLDSALATHLANVPPSLLGSQLDDSLLRSPRILLEGISVGELCADFMCLGRWHEAADCARKMLVACQYHHLPGYARMRSLWLEVRALVRSGDRAAAAQTLAIFVGTAHNSQRYTIARLRGEAELAESETERSRLLAAARDIVEDLALPLESRELALQA